MNKFPDINTQKKGIQTCKNYLQTIDNLVPKNINITPASTLLLKYGQEYLMDEKITFKGTRQQTKACFMNSYKMATSNSNYIYVEGYVDIGVLSIEHAWVIDTTNNNIVVDPTLPCPTKTDSVVYPRGYFGISFNTDYIQKVALRSGVYGILSYTNRPLFQRQDTPLEFLYK